MRQVLKPTNASVSVSGDIAEKKDISAIATVSKRFIAIGSDEDIEGENRIQLLHTEDDGHAVHNDILLLKDKEMDIEGIAADGNTIYVVGSHSSKRPKIKKSKKYEENRRKFYADKITNEQNRDWLYRVVIDKEGKEIAKERISLREIIAVNPVLKAFYEIPGKENGVNIEGLAVKDGHICIGFRGPVFRENYVPIMKL